MNIQEIDKWLDNEYGCSYTRLEELHDYFFEKYTDQKEEIERLNNIIKEVSKELKEFNEFYLEDEGDTSVYRYLNKLIEKLNEGKE